MLKNGLVEVICASMHMVYVFLQQKKHVSISLFLDEQRTYKKQEKLYKESQIFKI